jgi:hypothetical protein
MDTATQILIIILAVTLSVFLLIGIILGIYLIKLTGDIRKLSKSAERTASAVESAVTGAVKFTSPVFIADVILKYINKFKKTQKGNK